MKKRTPHLLIVTLATIGLAASLAACSPSTPAAKIEPTENPAPSAPTASIPDPYAQLVEVPSFDLTSETVDDGGQLDIAQYSGVFGVEGGLDQSPQLSWSGFPEETRSFVVSVFDADAPTGSGFWHWVVKDIPATTNELALGAGSADGVLPDGATAIVNDAGTDKYIGAAPPPGSGEHRYFITVTALKVPVLDVPEGASPALTAFLMGQQTVGRASIAPVAGE